MKASGKLFLMGIAMGVTGMSAKAQAQQPEDDRPPVISRDTIGATTPAPTPTLWTALTCWFILDGSATVPEVTIVITGDPAAQAS